MKRIKAMNGYTIYQMTARDEKQGNGIEGEFSIYFSSDIRDFGVEYSTPEFEGVDSLKVAVEMISDSDSKAFAQAKEELEEVTTAVTFEDIEARAEEIKAEAQEGEAMNEAMNKGIIDVLEAIGAKNIKIEPIYAEAEEEETMTTAQAIEAIISYFEENDDEFTEVIEELDSYNGYLGDDRYYDMEMLDEFYTGCEPTEILERAYYGRDDETWTVDEHGEKHYGEFCPNRAYFYYNGYGNLVSADYKDYSAHLDKWFAEKLIDEAYNIDSIPDDVQSIIDSIED